MDKDSFEYDEENWGNVVSVKKLQEQIEKMKNCWNCCMGSTDKCKGTAPICDNWRMKE